MSDLTNQHLTFIANDTAGMPVMVGRVTERSDNPPNQLRAALKTKQFQRYAQLLQMYLLLVKGHVRAICTEVVWQARRQAAMLGSVDVLFAIRKQYVNRA